MTKRPDWGSKDWTTAFASSLIGGLQKRHERSTNQDGDTMRASAQNLAFPPTTYRVHPLPVRSNPRRVSRLGNYPLLSQCSQICQISMGFPDPSFSSFPRLSYLLKGIRKGLSSTSKMAPHYQEHILVTHIRDALSCTGIDASQFSGHSFRIGAASTAAQTSLNDSLIQMLGRWILSAFTALLLIFKKSKKNKKLLFLILSCCYILGATIKNTHSTVRVSKRGQSMSYSLTSLEATAMRSFTGVLM